MKKITLLVAMVCGMAWTVNAQQKKAITVKIPTPTVQCDNCKKRIEDFMKHEEGVTKVNVDYKKKMTTVTYLGDRTNVENIKTAIANVGYDADDVKSNEESYKKLPSCCKKPADQ